MTPDPTTPYFLIGPWHEMTCLDAAGFPTVVNVVHDHPISQLRDVFDATFGALFPALDTLGVQPIGPPFSLYRRMPTETVDLEIGIPVDRLLDGAMDVGGITVASSMLPAGRIAVTSYFGAYDGLGDAWGRFMAEVSAAGEQPDFPFWEVYTTEPTPDTDPSTLRTDLVTRLRS